MKISIRRALLASVYFLGCALGTYSILRGDADVVRVLILLLVAITLLALLGKLGRWAQIVGVVVGSLYALIGLGGIGVGLWTLIADGLDAVPMLIIGCILLALGL